ncbi:hypothetical protein ZOSMA_252G00010 [Zostera marina]|uniref:Uncharacterized protein n=1 Tax=Zostera marina TaxID=29655 RepID=A0A0K9PI27_ZOSMR|nr:hypothetical protein ZOSMA_252G00010 [Zostera marina]
MTLREHYGLKGMDKLCVFVTSKATKGPHLLIKDWPSSMQIVRLISCDFMTNKEYTMKAEFLVFRPLSQHPLFDQLHDKKLQFQPPQQQPQRVPPINQSSMLEDSGRSQIMTEGIIQQQQQQQSQSNTLPPPGGNFNSK